MNIHDHAPDVPGEFGVDTDLFTEEDGRGDNVDQPLPDVQVDDAGRVRTRHVQVDDD